MSKDEPSKSDSHNESISQEILVKDMALLVRRFSIALVRKVDTIYLEEAADKVLEKSQ